MTGDEILDAMAHIDPDLIEEAEDPSISRSSSYWFAAIAAILFLIIVTYLLSDGNMEPGDATGPIQMNSIPSTTHPSSPMLQSPSNILFHSIADIKGLFAAADKGQDALDIFLAENISYYGTDFATQEDIFLFRDLLAERYTPCRDDYDISYFVLYYYPRNGWIEIFYDVDGIRYCFISSSEVFWAPDCDIVSLVNLDGVSAQLREGSFGNGRRLFATFHIGDQVISMWADTTDPNKVNLSDFHWGNLID
jgi:hypothetical protein